MHINPLVAWAAVRSKAVVLLLFVLRFLIVVFPDHAHFRFLLDRSIIASLIKLAFFCIKCGCEIFAILRKEAIDFFIALYAEKFKKCTLRE